MVRFAAAWAILGFVLGVDSTLAVAPQDTAKDEVKSEAAESAAKPTDEQSTTNKQPTNEQPTKRTDEPTRGLGRLPWVEGREEVRPTPTRLPSPRKTLQVFNIGESQIDAFFDGQPLEHDDEENLVRILDATRRFKPDDVQRWERDVDDWKEFETDPTSQRVEFFRIHGRVKSFEKRELLPEVSRLFEFKSYYLVTVEAPETDAVIRLCCLDIPTSWKSAKELNENIYSAGMFLKVGVEVEGRSELIFATSRIAWRPDNKTAFGNISNSEKYLAELGVDIGLMDAVQKRNGRKMGVADREPFYQILAAAPETDGESVALLTQPFSLPQAIQAPNKLQGQFFKVRGKARRITRVLVSETESDVRERFEMDHYFMIDFFIPLGDLSLQLSDGEGGASSPIYQNGFPAIACVRTLPKELADINKRLAERQSGEELLNEEIEITGVFFRLWAYRSEYVDAFDSSQRQISPMFLAATVSKPPRESFSNPYLGMGVGIGFVLAMAGVWIAVWRAGKSDTRFEKETLRRRLPEPETLDDLADEVPDGPDFSGLE